MRRRRHPSSVLLLGILFCGFFILLNSSLFEYKSVFCTGAGEQTPREIEPVVLGSNMFFLPYFTIRKALLRGDPSLQSVRFRPGFSDHLILHVILNDRIPFICFRCKNQLLGLDNHGVAFPMRGGKSDKSLREIELQGSARPIPGESVAPPLREMVSGLLPVLDSVPDVRFSKIILDSEEEWTFLTNKGVEIRAGSSEGLLSRLKLLPPILHVLGKQKFKAALVDLHSLDHPILKVIPR